MFIFNFLRNLVLGTAPEIAEPQVTEEPKEFKAITYAWPFPSPEPPNINVLLAELAQGVQTEGDHTFYYWGEQKRRHIRTAKGTETILARHMVWWMYGRLHPKTANGLTTNCGEAKCIKLSHLVLKTPNIPLGPDRKPIPAAVRVPKSQQPPLPPKVESGEVTKFDRYAKKDRTKCMSHKAYFATEARANMEMRDLNKRRPNNKRFYVYPCTLAGCGGWHLTKVNPKKYNRINEKTGSW